MECSQLLEKIEYQVIRGTQDNLDKIKLSKIIYDSRKIEPECMFLCIAGANADGHDYVNEAIAKGANVIVVEREVELPEKCDTVIIKVENTRYALAFVSAAYFGHPANQLKVIGVTGTKGKTTTTYLIKSILESAGYRVGLIGTIETIIGDKKIPAKNTTPESYILQETFAQMLQDGCQIVVMEVSSQGLMLHRTQGFTFEIGIFTNLEPDHIGPNEHKDFEEYLYCKSLLFQQCKIGLMNADDSHAKAIIKDHTCSLETFGLEQSADIEASGLKLVNEPGFLGVEFNTTGLYNMHVKIPSPGRFSVYNALTAIAVCRHFDVKEEEVILALRSTSVKGRIEIIPVSDEFTLMIDYAHNAMALNSLLTTLKEYNPKRLVCLFGCGGNRSRSRRFEMGEVSGRLADLSVITSDNPRFEEPLDIIKDIRSGIEKTSGKYVEIPDRKEAIAYVIKQGQPGDIIVLAGKGHEDYQEIKGVHYPMDERVIIQEILDARKSI